jgi:hypothetical protein
MPFGELVVPDEQLMRAVVVEMFGRSGNLEKFIKYQMCSIFRVTV